MLDDLDLAELSAIWLLQYVCSVYEGERDSMWWLVSVELMQIDA